MGRGIEEDTGTTGAEGVVPPPPRSPIKSKKQNKTKQTPLLAPLAECALQTGGLLFFLLF